MPSAPYLKREQKRDECLSAFLRLPGLPKPNHHEQSITDQPTARPARKCFDILFFAVCCSFPFTYEELSHMTLPLFLESRSTFDRSYQLGWAGRDGKSFPFFFLLGNDMIQVYHATSAVFFLRRTPACLGRRSIYNLYRFFFLFFWASGIIVCKEAEFQPSSPPPLLVGGRRTADSGISLPPPLSVQHKSM